MVMRFDVRRGGGGVDPDVDLGGSYVRVCPRTTFSFDGRATTTQDLPLSSPFLTKDWVSGVVSVRLHSKPAWSSATSSALVVVQNAVQVPDEPNTIYAADLTTVTIANADAAPKLYTQAISAPIGPSLRVVLRWQQGSAASSSASELTISVDVLGRSA